MSIDFAPQLTPNVRRQRPMSSLRLDVVTSATISSDLYREILSLCNEAYGEDLAELFGTFGAATHVIAVVGDRVVSHAMWVTRLLQTAGSEPIKTAYVEAVATLPAYEGNGYATEVMQHLTASIPTCYGLAALSPATTSLYSRLGWRFWRGPLSIRIPSGSNEPTPNERVMVLELPGGAKVNLDEPLSAEWREGELW